MYACVCVYVCVQLFAQRDYFKNRHHIWPSRIYFYVITFFAFVSEFFFFFFLLKSFHYRGEVILWSGERGRF